MYESPLITKHASGLHREVPGGRLPVSPVSSEGPAGGTVFSHADWSVDAGVMAPAWDLDGCPCVKSQPPVACRGTFQLLYLIRVLS